MKAAVLHAISDLRVDEVDRPAPAAGEVVIAVKACGICGSDVPRILTNGTYHFPTTPGHELSGLVVAVAADVPDSWIGVRCAAIPLIPCRRCEQCEVGQFAMCSNYDFVGSRRDGGFAEFVRVPVQNLVPLPREVSWEAGAMLEPATVALHVLRNTGFGYGSAAVVFGLGAVGMFVAQWCLVFGASQVIGVDLDEQKLTLAREVGISHTINPLRDDVSASLAELTGGSGADFAFEASGAGQALVLAVECTRKNGTIGLLGRPNRDVTLATAFFEQVLRKQLTIKGTWSFEFTQYPHLAWTESAEAIAAGKIAVEPLISHRIGLEGILETVRQMKAGDAQITKAIVKPCPDLLSAEPRNER